MEEIKFLQERFTDHYSRNHPEVPPRFGRREWGFMFFSGGYMVRHMAFSSTDNVNRFFSKEAPAHAYYSTAYYSEPSARRMTDKGWLGADLIFDLDSDHLPGAESMTYEEMLSAVRREMAKLLDEFILGDLGIEEEHIRLVFSGGRGYHLHVSRPDIVPLSSGARREIIDYISGRGLNLDVLLKKIAIESTTKGRFTKDKFAYRLPPADRPGWGGRITRAVIADLEKIAALPHDQALKEITVLEGIGKKSGEQILERLGSDWKDDLSMGNIDIFPDRFPVLPFVKAVVERGRLEAMGEADEPVTTDIKRLIRVPGSLHGKTGLKVVELSIDSFRNFEPLEQAVAFGDGDVTVHLKEPFSMTMRGVRHDLNAGRNTVPEHLAVFLIARRTATLSPPEEA